MRRDEELCLRQQLSRIRYNLEWRYAQSSNHFQI